jgi:hypothetical protein
MSISAMKENENKMAMASGINIMAAKYSAAISIS